MELKTTHTYYKIVISFLIILATTVVYIQVRNHQFISFDDYLYIKNNAYVLNGLKSESIKWAFTSFSYASNWHPLTWISHMLDCQIFGYNPGAHHIVNLVFHLLNSIILFLFLNRATGSIWRSALVAALFALHPLHVESVAWVAERKDLLSTFFGLLSLYSYTVYVKHRTRKRYYWQALFLLALGLMSKSMLVTLPFVLLLFDVWPLQRIKRGNSFPQRIQENHPNDRAQYSISQLVVEKIPFFLLSGTICFITIVSQSKGGGMAQDSILTIGMRISNALISYVDYLRQLVWPMDLACFYPYDLNTPLSRIIISVIVLAGITFLSLRFFKPKPFLLIGWLFYLGTLVPVIGLVQVGGQARADRYTYLPLLGIFIMIAWSIPKIEKKMGQTLAVTGILTIILFYMLVTWKQAGYWADHFKLFKHAISVTHNNYRAHSLLGRQYYINNQVDKAIEHFEASIKARSSYLPAYVYLGQTLTNQGRLDEAAIIFRKALQIAPNSLKVNKHFAYCLYSQGKLDEALNRFHQALRISPDSFSYNYIGIIKTRLGKLHEAISFFKNAISTDAGYIDAYYNLGLVYRENMQLDDAVEMFEKVIQIEPQYKKAQGFLKGALAEKKEIIERIDQERKSLEHHPDNASTYIKLGDLYLKWGKTEKATDHYNHAYQLADKDLMVLNKLAFFNINIKNYQQAIAFFEKIINQRPTESRYYYNIACLYAYQNKTGKAIEWLKKAIDKGYNNWEKIRTDKDLDNIRSTSDYSIILRNGRLGDKQNNQSNDSAP